MALNAMKQYYIHRLAGKSQMKRLVGAPWSILTIFLMHQFWFKFWFDTYFCFMNSHESHQWVAHHMTYVGVFCTHCLCVSFSHEGLSTCHTLARLTSIPIKFFCSINTVLISIDFTLSVTLSAITLHYWLRLIESGQLRFWNFVFHFMWKCDFHFLIN